MYINIIFNKNVLLALPLLFFNILEYQFACTQISLLFLMGNIQNYKMIQKWCPEVIFVLMTLYVWLNHQHIRKMFLYFFNIQLWGKNKPNQRQWFGFVFKDFSFVIISCVFFLILFCCHSDRELLVFFGVIIMLLNTHLISKQILHTC